jgi:hypothetical protein
MDPVIWFLFLFIGLVIGYVLGIVHHDRDER